MSRFLNRIGTTPDKFFIQFHFQEYTTTQFFANPIQLKILLRRNKKQLGDTSILTMKTKNLIIDKNLTIKSTLYYSKKKGLYQEKVIFIEIFEVKPEGRRLGVIKIDLAKYANYYTNNRIEEKKELEEGNVFFKNYLIFQVMVKHAGAAGPDAEQSNPPEEKNNISKSTSAVIKKRRKSSSEEDENNDDYSEEDSSYESEDENNKKNKTKNTLSAQIENKDRSKTMPIEKKEEAIKNVANKERKKFTEEKKEETRPPSKTLKEKINERINKQSNDSLNQTNFSAEQLSKDQDKVTDTSILDHSDFENFKSAKTLNNNDRSKILKNEEEITDSTDTRLMKESLAEEFFTLKQKLDETEERHRDNMILKDEKIADLFNKIANLEQEIEKVNTQNAQLNENNYENERKIGSLKTLNNNLNEKLFNLNQKIQSATLEDYFSKKDQDLKLKLNQAEEKMNENERIINEKNEKIKNLNEELKELTNKFIKSTTDNYRKIEQIKKHSNEEIKEKLVAYEPKFEKELKLDLQVFYHFYKPKMKKLEKQSRTFEFSFKSDMEKKESTLIQETLEKKSILLQKLSSVFQAFNLIETNNEELDPKMVEQNLLTLKKSVESENSEKISKYEKAILILNREKQKLEKLNQELNESIENLKEFFSVEMDRRNLIDKINLVTLQNTELSEQQKQLETQINENKLKLAEIVNIVFENGGAEMVELIEETLIS